MSDYGSSSNRMRCTLCQIQTDETLTLQCEHDLCLPCACRKLLSDEQKYGTLQHSSIYQTIRCDLCNALTAIDQPTADEIMRYRKVERSSSPNTRLNEARIIVILKI
jgi:hypothetical protein